MNNYRTMGLSSIYRRIIQLAAIVLFFLYALALVLEFDFSEKTIGMLVLFTSIVEVSLAVTNPRVYKSGLLMVFYCYNILCHNGFVIARFFDESYVTFQSTISMSFLYNAYYHESIFIANIVLLAFAFGNDIVLKGQPVSAYYWYIETEVNDEGNRKADIVGIIALLIGTAYIAILILRGGLFLAGYNTFLNAADGNTVYGFMVVITSLSMALILAAGTKRGIVIGLIIYAFLTLLQFSVGNRGEVMYSAVVCFALYSIRFKNIRLKHVLIILAVSIVVIPIVRISRELRIGGYMFNPITSLLDVFCEEGIQISPFTHMVSYVKSTDGPSHVWGMTYINDFVAFIARRLGTESPFAVKEYIIKSIMPRKGMGFSMIAELYYNFTVVGAIVLYFIFARIINKVDWKMYNNLYTDNQKIVISMLIVELINLTRNDASTMPLYLTFTAILSLAFILLSGGTKKASRYKIRRGM